MTTIHLIENIHVVYKTRHNSTTKMNKQRVLTAPDVQPNSVVLNNGQDVGDPRRCESF